VRLFWLSKQSLVPDKKYLFKLGTTRVEMEVEAIERVLDASTLETKQAQQVCRHEIAECVLRFENPIAFDLASEMPETGRFVIVDDYEISGGGIVAEALPDENTWIYENIAIRNEKWEEIAITEEMRAERYNQKACMIVITGSPQDILRKELAKNLTESLFHSGKLVYFLGMANLLYGISADIRGVGEDVRPEHMRRLGEIGNMMMHAGMMLVVSAREITEQDVRTLRTEINERNDRLITIWAGDTITTNLEPDLQFAAHAMPRAIDEIKSYLKENGYIFSFERNHSI